MSELISRTLGDKSLQWDIYSQRARDAEVHMRENRIESIRFPILSEGFSVRVIRRRDSNSDEPMSGIGMGQGSSLENEGDIRRSTEFATRASKLTSFPDYNLPSDQPRSVPAVNIADKRIESDLPGAAVDLAEQAMSLMGSDPEIRVSFCKIRLTEIETTLQNSHGVHYEKKETFAYFEAGLSPKSISKKLAEYWPRVLCRRIDDLNLQRDVPRWSRFAKDSSNASAPETGKYSLITPSVVLSEMVPPVVSFHSSASALKKGMSRWKEPGQRVWSDKVTVSDDGLLDYGLATSPFDDEGTQQQRTEIIRDGEFRNHIANRMYSNFVSGKKSTGNGIKTSRSEGVLCYGDEINLLHTNIVMKAGDSNIEEMIRETLRGILIEQFSWMVPEAITGSFGAEIRHAYLVENGEIRNPLKGGVVNGSFFESDFASGENDKGVFDSLDLISRQTMMAGSSMLPSVRFPTVRISGS